MNFFREIWNHFFKEEEPDPMKYLIAGLGNMGREYDGTRHNVGFEVVDFLAKEFEVSFKNDSLGDIAEFRFKGRTFVLLKPSTFMNLSGDAVGGFARYYKINPENILVVHDELDLLPGALRLKKGGGSGGHRGLNDIIAKLGSKDFYRLRIGIGHPGSAAQVSGYVLQKAPKPEAELIENAIRRAAGHITDIVSGNHAAAMNELHRKQD